MTSAMTIRHYLQFKDLSADEYAYLLRRAAFIKGKFKAFEKHHPFADPDRTLAMIFEKASTPHPGELRGRHVPARRLGGAT